MTRVLAVVFVKEIRALAPLWAVCMLLVLASRLEFEELRGVAILAYGLGSCALGAHAFGHEYSHRTIAHALSQPLDRRWLLLSKFAALITFVTLLGMAGHATVLQDFDDVPATPNEMARLVWLIAVLLAPVLTLLCRSTLAGAIFSASLPATLAMVGGLIGLYLFDPNAAAVDRFQLDFFWRGMPLLFVLSAATVWPAFLRLQAIEGRGREFHWPQWLRATHGAPSRRRPLWQLVTKELRLQQMVFAIAAIYIVIATVVLIRHAVNPSFEADALVPVTYMYVALLALLAGSLASAEERQLRTVESQLLLPMAAWRQWLVKAAVVFGVGATLAVVLPSGVMLFLRDTRVGRMPWVELLVLVTVLASASLYVSSLTTGCVRAITGSAPFVAAGMLLLAWSSAAARVLLRELMGSSRWLISSSAELNSRIAVVVLALCFAAIMIRFAHVNHRSGEHSFARTSLQIAYTAVFVMAAGVLSTLAAYLPAKSLWR